MRALILLLAFTLPQIQRVSTQPVLAPQAGGFESAGVFNPAVIMRDGRFVMLYRAQDQKGTSRLGYAESGDGVHFTRRGQPVLSPEAEYEKDGGVEDPRLVSIDGQFWLTYTGYNKKDAQLCVASSTDLIHWSRKGVIMPAYKGRWNVNWTKSGAMLDRKINGKYWMYFMADAKGRPNQMGVASSDDLVHWTEALDQPIAPTRAGMFDSKVAEPGPPPVLTRAGILLIYNGADDNLVYRTGWLLLDKTDPTKVLARSERPLLQPDLPWEKAGQVPNVIFVEGLVQQPGRWLLYYGGADKYVGVASMPPPR